MKSNRWRGGLRAGSPVLDRTRGVLSRGDNSMTVEVYIGKEFRYGQERRAFGEFVQDMLNRYGDSDELYFIAAELDANAAAIDILLLHAKGLILCDLKYLSAVNTATAARVHLQCKQNGPWIYRLPEGKECLLGGHGKHDSPYQQLFRFRHEFADWLSERSRKIFGNFWTHGNALDHISAWSVISPGFDGSLDDMDLPWEEIRDNHGWYKILPLGSLAWEFNCAVDLHIQYSETQLRAILTELGVTRCEALETILPVAAPAGNGFFSSPHVCHALIDREPEREQLVQYLEDSTTSVLSLRGLGGTGKTMLAAWAAEAAQARGRKVFWVDCSEKEVTDESFLAAVAGGLHSPQAAGFILDKDRYPLENRMQAAVDVLTKEPVLLVFNDFHKVSRTHGIDRFLSHLVLHSKKVKVLLATRDYESCLDNPAWRPGAAREIRLGGLPVEAISAYIAADLGSEPDEAHCSLVYERTSGNPYAMRLVTALVRKYGWSAPVGELPLFNATQVQDAARWFSSLLETVSPDAQQLAMRLSVCRTDLSDGLIAFLWHDPKKAAELTFELLQHTLLQRVETPEGIEAGLYSTHEFIRDYLYAQLRDEKRTKVHLDAARYYLHCAGQDGDALTRAEEYLEAVYHFEKTQTWKEVQESAGQAFELFSAAGDWDRADSAARSGLQAAQILKDDLGLCRWLVEIAARQQDLDQLKESGKNLQEAEACLARLALKPAAQSNPMAGRGLDVRSLEARIFLLKGRLAYLTSDFADANVCFDRALEVARQVGDRLLEAESLLRIGRIERQKAQYDRAEQHFIEASALGEEIDDFTIRAESTSHLGLLARKRGNLGAARTYFQTAYQLAVAAGDEKAREINLSLLGDLAKRENDYEQAEQIFRECLEVSRSLGGGTGIRVNLGQLAETLIYRGKFAEAQQLLDEAAARSSEVNDGIGIAWTLRRKGLLLKAQGQMGEGNRLILQGIEKLEEIGNCDYVEDFRKALGPVRISKD
jgi:tetratricopeptide (TPR) repeat protein